MDSVRFTDACDTVIHNPIMRQGIGTLKEKTVHAILKYYYEPDTTFHEIRIGSYVADIAKGTSIIEIQTGNFNTMRKKLNYFLNDYQVTIAYPIPHNKWLRWLNEDTGEISPKRKSPKVGTPYMAFKELYRIKDYLNHPNLHIDLVFIDLEELRLLNGWSKDRKRGSSRYERIPVALSDVVHIHKLSDYNVMFPQTLPTPFHSKDYSKCTKLTLSNAQTALNILNYLKLVNRIGKKGNSYLYEKSDVVTFDSN